MSGVASIDLTAVAALTIGTWLLRVTFVLLLPAERLPDTVVRALQHLAPATLASLCAAEVTSVLRHADALEAAGVSAIVAVTAAVAWWTGNLTGTVTVGIGGVLLLDLFLLG